jgi:glycosyltransferase involved in cell wall biosynthesis
METNEKSLKALFWRPEFYGASTNGGVPTLYRGLTGGLIKLGHQCMFASGGRLDLDSSVRTFYIPYNKLLRNFPEVLCLQYNRKSVKQILKIIDNEKVDFLFQHNHDFHYGGSLVKKKTGIPFLLHVDSVEYWVKKNWGKLYLEKFLKIAEEIQWHNSDAIFVISEVVKNQLVELGVDANKIIISPNGVDPDFFSPDVDGNIIRKSINIEDKFICGFAGTFGQWHGLEVIADTIHRLIDRIPNIFFLFVGDGQLRPRIEEIIKKNNVENYSYITGLVDYSTVPNYLSACDVLLAPSVHSVEGSAFFNSPIKLFEYMSMQKPIVATNIGQQGVVINEGFNGIFCEEKSSEDLAEKIHYIYKNRDLALELAKNARTDVMKNYDWRQNANRIITAYNKIIKNRA